MPSLRSIIIKREDRRALRRFLRITEIVEDKKTKTTAVAEKTYSYRIVRTKLSPRSTYDGEQVRLLHTQRKEEHGIKYIMQHRAYLVEGDKVIVLLAYNTVRFQHESFVSANLGKLSKLFNYNKKEAL